MLGCDDQTVINRMYLEDLQMKSAWKIVGEPHGATSAQTTSDSVNVAAVDGGQDGNSTRQMDRVQHLEKGLHFPTRVGVSPVSGVKVFVWNSTLTPRGKSAWNCEAIDQHGMWVAMPLAPKIITAKIRAIESFGRFVKRCNKYKGVKVSRKDFLKLEGDTTHWCAICRCCFDSASKGD